MNLRKVIAVILTATSLLTSAVAAETIHVDQTLESAFLTLHLDADIEKLPQGTPLTVYETDYPPLDAQSWVKMFPDEAIKQVEMFSDKKNLSIEMNEMYAKYFSEEARLGYRYVLKDYFRIWENATVGQQATGLQITPEQAINMAQVWIDKFQDVSGWNGYILDSCYTMPSEKEYYEILAAMGIDISYDDEITTEGCYVVEYVKNLTGYTVAYDYSPYIDERKADTRGDYIQLFIDDSGIGYVTGYGRSYNAMGTESLQITLDEAIDILRENMDYAECYPDEMPCEITEISLCYRLVQTLPVSDKDAAVRMEARPAWRFAAGINRWNQQVFFMFIDAVTGEVLP